MTLPLAGPAAWPGRVRLVRRFQRPPVHPDREALSLRLERVDGLVAAWLNGQEVARPAPGTSAVTVRPEGPLPARNVLVLEVEPFPSPDAPGAEALWGDIALVIRSIGA